MKIKPALWILGIAAALCLLLAGYAGSGSLAEIGDSRNYSDLFSNTAEPALIRGEQSSRILDREDFLTQLQQVRILRLTPLRSRAEDRDKTHQIYLRRNTYVNFSADYSRVWIDNGVKPTYTYFVLNPGHARRLFEQHWAEGAPLITWFTGEDGSSQPITDVPGLPGYMFTCTQDAVGHRLQAEQGGQSRVIFTGWPIHSAYFTDLNGGAPELCVTVSYGFGIIDQRIQVYDFDAGKSCELEARGICNYRLYPEDGRLMTEASGYATGEVWGRGELCMVCDEESRLQQLAYLLSDPGNIPQVPAGFSGEEAQGYLNWEAGGEPFATSDTPWDWCRDIHLEAVHTVMLNDWENDRLSRVALEGLLPLLNGLPRSAFRAGSISDEETTYRFCSDSEKELLAVVFDHANQLAVYLHYEAGTVEMMISEEIESISQSHIRKLPGLTVWQIEDSALAEYMELMLLNHPGVHLSIRERNRWQPDVQVPIAGGQITLGLLEGWEYELFSQENSSGIRIRPAGETHWICCSFWPEGYEGRNPELEQENGGGRDWVVYSCYQSDPRGKTDVPWVYRLWHTERGDLVQLNEDQVLWEKSHMEELSDMEFVSQVVFQDGFEINW